METATFLFPLFLVVLRMRHDSKNEDFLTRIQDPRNQAVFIAANVKDDTIAHQARGIEGSLHIGPGLPCDSFAIDMSIPSLERSSSIIASRRFPELLQSGFGDHPHPDHSGVS